MKMERAQILRVVAAAIANARGGRRGMPPIVNILELLPTTLLAEVMADAEAVLSAMEQGGFTWN